jgi:hypothetical protein
VSTFSTNKKHVIAEATANKQTAAYNNDRQTNRQSVIARLHVTKTVHIKITVFINSATQIGRTDGGLRLYE